MISLTGEAGQTAYNKSFGLIWGFHSFKQDSSIVTSNLINCIANKKDFCSTFVDER